MQRQQPTPKRAHSHELVAPLGRFLWCTTKKKLHRPEREVNEMCIIEVMLGYLNPMWALNMYANSTKQELNYTCGRIKFEDGALNEAICVHKVIKTKMNTICLVGTLLSLWVKYNEMPRIACSSRSHQPAFIIYIVC